MNNNSVSASARRVLSKAFVFATIFIFFSSSVSAVELYIDPQFTVTRTDDIQYGSSLTGDGIDTPRFLDLYQPVGIGAPTNNKPAIVMMHGGYYLEDDKRDCDGPVAATYAEAFAKRGYVAVSINYRLLLEDKKPAPPGAPLWLPKERHPEWMSAKLAEWGVTEQQYFDEIAAATADLAMAVNWLRAHANTYGIDPNRIASGGYSAGAVSSLMLGADAIDGASAEIGAVFSIAGGLFGMETAIDSDTPGVFVLHGTEDHVIPYAVEIGSLKAALNRAGVAFESHIVEGSTHATVPWDLVDSPALYTFMIGQLGSPTNRTDSCCD